MFDLNKIFMIFCVLRVFVALISVLSFILNNDSYQNSMMNIYIYIYIYIYIIEKFFHFVANAFGDFYAVYSKKI